MREQLQVSGGTFDGNHTPNGFGGAIDYEFTAAAGDKKAMSLTNVTFTDNTSQQGGAVNCNGVVSQGQDIVTITGSLFSNNQVTSSSNNAEGGGLYVGTDASSHGTFTLNVQNDTFYQNTADHGGAIALDNTGNGATATNTANLADLTITANTGNKDGGGLWIGNGQAGVVNSIIAGNKLGRVSWRPTVPTSSAPSSPWATT